MRPSGLPGGCRALFAFAAASAIVHAAVLVFAPGLLRSSEPPPVILEVALQAPRPLPMAAPETEPPAPRPREPQRRPPDRVEPPVPRPEVTRPPVLALPSLSPAAEEAFAVPAPVLPETKPPPPASASLKSPPAAPALSPPTFNAAYLRNPAPRYPLAARRSGEQGTVTLRVQVTPEGAPGRVEVEKTSGSPHLDNAALEAVKGWRFTPARRGAEPVEGWVLVPIVFRLES